MDPLGVNVLGPAKLLCPLQHRVPNGERLRLDGDLCARATSDNAGAGGGTLGLCGGGTGRASDRLGDPCEPATLLEADTSPPSSSRGGGLRGLRTTLDEGELLAGALTEEHTLDPLAQGYHPAGSPALCGDGRINSLSRSVLCRLALAPV